MRKDGRGGWSQQGGACFVAAASKGAGESSSKIHTRERADVVHGEGGCRADRGDMTDRKQEVLELHKAAATGDLSALMALLNRSVDPDAADAKGVRALHHAAREGQAEVVTLLLDRGGCPNAADKSGLTPLHLATGGGRVGAARALLERGAEVDVDSLVLAHDRSDRRMLKLLHDFGLRNAIAKGDRQAEVEQFLADGASVNARDADLCAPLHVAASVGNAEAARTLIAHGADVDARDAGGETPLHKAAAHGAGDVVELLVAHGADVAARDQAGMTPENYARTMGRQALAARLGELRQRSAPAR